MKNGGKRGVIVSLTVFAAAGLFCAISAVIGLLQPKRAADFFSADKGERIYVETEYITPCVYEVKHSVSFIPAGHEYYYAFKSSDGRAYLARLGGSFGEGLDGEGFRHTSGLCLAVAGKVKRLGDAAELGEVISRFSEDGIELDGEFYLDTIYQTNYLLRIAVGIGLLLFSSAFAVFLANKGGFKIGHKIYCNAVTIVGIASMLGGAYLLNMK